MTISRSLATGAAVLTVAMALSVPAAQAAVCKPLISGKAAHISKMMARFKARGSWKNYAVSLHGPAYGKFSQAKSKSVKCWKTDKWRCAVRARPCKPGFGGPDGISS